MNWKSEFLNNTGMIYLVLIVLINYIAQIKFVIKYAQNRSHWEVLNFIKLNTGYSESYATKKYSMKPVMRGSTV